MTEKHQIANRETQTAATTGEQEVLKARATEVDRIFVPEVDIHEDSEFIRLEANMPGVDPNSVDVNVENGILTLEGHVRIEEPQGYTLVGQEHGVGRYRRDFELSDAVDTNGIKARVSQGVLAVTLPKHEKVKTRKIRIETEGHQNRN